MTVTCRSCGTSVPLSHTAPTAASNWRTWKCQRCNRHVAAPIDKKN